MLKKIKQCNLSPGLKFESTHLIQPDLEVIPGNNQNLSVKFKKDNFPLISLDEDLEKPSQYVQNKKIKTFSNVHDFFYEQSNCNIGGSENNLQLDIKVTEKELITNNLENTSEKYVKLPNKLFWLFEK